MKLPLQMKRPGATAAGIFSLVLGSVVLLCGAGSVPVENFSPQGPMQADLNAGGHNLTNIATVSATNVVVSGTLTAANLGSAATNAASAFAPAGGPFPWTEVSGAPAIQTPITLTTSGSSGAATFSGSTLNIPNYGAAGVASFDSRTGAVTLQASDLAISGASLTALPTNASLYPTLNQSTTGTASFARTSGTATFASSSGTATALTGTITGAQITTNGSGGYQAYTVPANSVMLVLGDSISTGYGGAGTSACWEYYLSKQIPTLDIYSFGIVGSTSGPVSNTSSGLYLLSQGSGLYTKWSNGTVSTASGSFASILANYSGAKFGVAAYGANDALGVNGVTASTFQSNMASIYSSLNSLGCTVIGTSILPRAGSGTSTPAFAQHLYNSYVRELGPPYVTSGTSRWSLFADVGGVGGLTDYTDTVVFEGDEVHPNPMGHQIYANVVYRRSPNKTSRRPRSRR
jgi:hypothetical protein